ncbi:hypothetical protein CIG19_00970 [Enterobacterales bacterium CwR94]|nr:hypothetical protein CIG19_00970 [Enterobacterales bacterium CwR94]
MALYLSLLAFLSVPFFHLPIKHAVVSVALLVVITLTIKFFKLKYHAFFYMLQLSGSFGVVVLSYQTYGLPMSIVAFIVSAGLIILATPATNKLDVPPAPTLSSHAADPELSDIADIKAEITTGDISPLGMNIKYPQGMYTHITQLAPPAHIAPLSWNKAFIIKLQIKTEAISQLSHAMISEAHIRHPFPATLYAFYDREQDIKGFQCHDISVYFKSEVLCAIRIIELSLRGNEMYRLALETPAQLIYLDKFIDHTTKADIQLHTLAISLASVWQLPLRLEHQNLN